MSLNHPDSRFLALHNWLKNDLNLEIHSLNPASSDASFRRYFRVHHTQGTQIVMDAPPDKENITPFIQVDRLLARYGLPVPDILASNLQDGFLLLEDFGNRNLLHALNQESVELLYDKAMGELFKLQSHVALEGLNLNAYDRPLLLRELSIFYEWFLGGLLGLTLPSALTTTLNELLIQSALEQSQVCVHRDFHSRNLMLRPDESLGIIDFQDAVIGPVTYDLASLLRDCYIEWPQSDIERWLQHYHQRLRTADLTDTEYPQFKRWFDWMGMQRHLKAIGIFARLHLRDGKSGYLADIPRTLNYVTAVAAEYQEFSDFHQFLSTQIVPIYQDFL